MANDEKYILTLTKEQALTISKACEFYSRVMMGQFGEIAYETMLQSIKQDDFCARREMMEDLLIQARKFAFPDLNGPGHSYGIGHNKSADRAWNAYQALRYAMAWHEHPEGGITVNFQKPYPAGGEAVPDCMVESADSANQNGDLISRAALLTDILMLPHNGDIISSEEVEQAIADAPAVYAEPVRNAEWVIYGMHMNGVIGNWHCSVCNGTSLKDSNFCPNCGAKMDAR